MEDKKDYRQQNIQKFYFDDEGKLIVESNKGVWVDGEQYVKMYGNFSCNAKTMGVIIKHFKGVPVEIGIEEKIRHTKDHVVDDILNIFEHTIETYCILGIDKERVKEYEDTLAVNNFTTKELEESRKTTKLRANELMSLKKSVAKFNALPWYKRMFKKIEIKNN